MVRRRVPRVVRNGRQARQMRSICVPDGVPEKSIDFVGAFFNEINPFRICEIPFGREILLRNVKYALRRVIKDLFHFTENEAFYFTKTPCIYFVAESQKSVHESVRILLITSSLFTIP